MEQKRLSIVLKVCVIVGAICLLVLDGIIVPPLYSYITQASLNLAHTYEACSVFMVITAIPVFVALVMVWKIAVTISMDNSFCMANVKRLRCISLMAVIDVVLCIVAGVVIGVRSKEQIGILVLICALVVCGIAFAALVYVLSYLTYKAAEIRRENDLTV